MPAYSHRDHRVFRAAYRLVAVVAVLTVALVGLSFLIPWPWVGILAVLALAALGGTAILRSESLVEGYVDDVRRVRRGETVPPVLRLEVVSRIELERPVFVGARPSPNARRPRAEIPAPGRGGSADPT